MLAARAIVQRTTAINLIKVSIQVFPTLVDNLEIAMLVLVCSVDRSIGHSIGRFARISGDTIVRVKF